MAIKISCENCGNNYNPNNYNQCPGCKFANPTIKPIQLTTPANRGSESSQRQTRVAANTEMEATLLDLVEAQNRTTHAVRSLAITFVAAPVIAFLVAIALVLAIHFGNSGVMIFVGLFAIFASLATLIIALTELAKSKVE